MKYIGIYFVIYLYIYGRLKGIGRIKAKDQQINQK